MQIYLLLLLELCLKLLVTEVNKYDRTKLSCTKISGSNLNCYKSLLCDLTVEPQNKFNYVKITIVNRVVGYKYANPHQNFIVKTSSYTYIYSR